MSSRRVNKVCAQCIHECKQPWYMEIIQCPKFKSPQTKNALPSRRGKNAVVQNKRRVIGK